MSNPYEAGVRKAIPAVLVYPERHGQWLMIHRNARPGDYHYGKWNGLGGKCEPDESFLEAAQRELFEESGLKLSRQRFLPLGFLQFPNFKPHRHEDWNVAVFRVSVPEGKQPRSKNPEGELEWVRSRDVLKLNLWKGDRIFLPHVLKSRPFSACIWYQGERVKKHWLAEL